MSGEINIDLVALDKHQNEIRALMGNMPSAADDASRAIDPQAFGVIGSTWSWALREWFVEGDEFINNATRAGIDVADRVRDMTDEYRHRDGAIKSEIEKILAALQSSDRPQAKQGPDE